MINKELLPSRRYFAIRKLQEKLLKSPPSPWSKIYEKALDLALSEKRSDSPHLYYRLLDDAKRTVRRDRQRVPTISSFYIQNEDGQEEMDETLAVDTTTPEDILNVRQEIELICQFCRTRHRFSLAVFHFMMNGYTVTQIAQCLDISISMVKKLRAEIAKKAKTIITL